MNIFEVLSQGKSRLHEPSMSAMLGYLMDSNRDHGLGDSFVRHFLTAIDDVRFKNILSMRQINSQALLEEPYELKGERKDIDIEVSILDKDKNELHRIIIENKIKIGAASAKQLSEYYAAIIEDEPTIQNLSFVYLTPNSKTSQLTAEFENLHLVNQSHKKYWLHWSSSEKCIVSIIRELLSLEASGQINPINEYIRHTLKAFVKHSLNTLELSKGKIMRTCEDIGEIIDEAEIETKGGRYRVVKRDSSQIQVFNLETGEKEVARHILAQYIDEKRLKIAHRKYNTRTIGRMFFDLKNKI